MTGSTDGRMSADDWSRYIQWTIEKFKEDEDVKTKAKTADPPVGQSLPAGEAIRMSGALNVMIVPKTQVRNEKTSGIMNDSRYRRITAGRCLSFEVTSGPSGPDAGMFPAESPLWVGYLVWIDWIPDDARSIRIWRRPNESVCWTQGMKAEFISIANISIPNAELATVQAEMIVPLPAGGSVQVKMTINASYRAYEISTSGSWMWLRQ